MRGKCECHCDVPRTKEKWDECGDVVGKSLNVVYSDYGITVGTGVFSASKKKHSGKDKVQLELRGGLVHGLVGGSNVVDPKSLRFEYDEGTDKYILAWAVDYSDSGSGASPASGNGKCLGG